MRLQLAAVVIILAPSIPRIAGACSRLASNGGVYESFPSGDVTPPGAVTVGTDTYFFDHYGACGTPKDTCARDGGGTVELRVTAADDRDASDVGFVFRVVRGALPEGLQLPATPVRSNEDNVIYFDHRSDSVDFDLEIRAVDRNMNMGPAIVVTIES